MKPIRNIVIGTSLSEPSDGVVRTGIAIAKAAGATPWLIHAGSPLLDPSGASVDAIWTEKHWNQLRERIDDQARRTWLSAIPGSVPDQVRLTIGSPHREILMLARDLDADLVVVGASDAGLGILGSTADRVIRKASCPVLVVRSEAAYPPTRIEIPVDLSPISANALRKGLGFLSRMKLSAAGTEVLFVLNPFEVGGSITFTPEQIRRFADEELRRFVEINAPSAATSENHAHRLKTRVITGYAREEILGVLKERQVDLAVLGTHGRSGFERLMVGSVAAGVMRGAECNLLVVPPGVEHREELAGADWIYISDENPVAANPS